MRILALETTETAGSLAAACDDKLLLEMTLGSETRSAQSLAPALETLLGQIGWQPRDVELVAVAVGPGSFTGLRVGVTTAKTFAYSVGANVFGVQTLDAIASAVPADVDWLSAAIDAQRGQVAAQEFRRDSQTGLRPLGPWRLLDVPVWLNGLEPGTCVASPMLRKIADRVPSHVRCLPSEYWAASASGVARLAAERFAAGQRQELWTLTPVYCRRSAAEEKWEANRHVAEGRKSDARESPC